MKWILAILLAFSTSQTYKPSNEPLTINENLHGGRVLRLNDNSMWEVAPKDVNYTQLWVTPFEVRVTHTGNSDYPYTLTNETSNTSVRVRHVETMNPSDLPKEPPPPPPSVEPQQPIEPFPPVQEKSPKMKKQPPPSEQPHLNESVPGDVQDPGQLPGSQPKDVTPDRYPANPFSNS